MTSSRKTRPLLPIAIQRYFDVALYLLVLTGVGTLASTGTLGIPGVLFVGAALMFRGYLLAKRRTWIFPEKWTSFLTIAYVIFYLADYFLISRTFLGSTVHLVLFVMVVRLFSAQRDRDQYLLIIIAFLMVLAASVLTVDSLFLVTFTAFIFMAIVTCILMEMKQSSAKARFQSANSADPMAHRHMAFSIVRIVPGLVLLIALGGAAIFFFLPRMSSTYLGTFSQGTDLTTGFSDHVELGGIGRIQQSNALVMHIAIDGDKGGAFDLKWRGITLNVFDGRNWSDSHSKYVVPSSAGAKFVLRDPGTLQHGSSHGSTPAHLIHYQVLMEPMGSTVFFLAPKPEFMRGNYRLIGRDSGGAVFDEDGDHPISEYEAASDISAASRGDLRSASGNFPPGILAEYMATPTLDPRIPELAQKITAQKENNYDRAVALETYLHSHFGYTLQLSRTHTSDPLAEFLFVRKQGHCEYFASAMAIMLREIGIPSRVVNGFRTGEFNDLTSQYLIRESDAHSWVEAYFPGYGWVAFDPTPAGAIEPRTGWNRASLYLDAMASFWREWIVSYDAGHQSSLGHIAARDSLHGLEHFRKWTIKQYQWMLAAARRTQAGLAERPVRWGAVGTIALIVLALLASANQWARFLKQARLASNSAKSPRVAASVWYERMVRKVGRRGWHKRPGQTPTEFLTVIADGSVKKRVAQFTTVYESARFGGSAADADSLSHLYEEIADAVDKKKFSPEESLAAK